MTHLRHVRQHSLAWLVVVPAVIGAALIVIGAGLAQTPEEAPLPEPFTLNEAPMPTADPPAAMAADRLVIGSIKVDAPTLAGDVTANTLQIPEDPAKLTLYSGGGQPCGEAGTVLVAGHVSSYGTHGALWPLSKIEPNAVAHLTCTDATVTSWRAVEVRVERKRDLPPDVFDADGEHRLVIVTCGGPVLPDGYYRDNVIVYFEPVPT